MAASFVKFGRIGALLCGAAACSIFARRALADRAPYSSVQDIWVEAELGFFPINLLIGAVLPRSSMSFSAAVLPFGHGGLRASAIAVERSGSHYGASSLVRALAVEVYPFASISPTKPWRATLHGLYLDVGPARAREVFRLAGDHFEGHSSDVLTDTSTGFLVETGVRFLASGLALAVKAGFYKPQSITSEYAPGPEPAEANDVAAARAAASSREPRPYFLELGLGLAI